MIPKLVAGMFVACMAVLLWVYPAAHAQEAPAPAAIQVPHELVESVRETQAMWKKSADDTLRWEGAANYALSQYIKKCQELGGVFQQNPLGCAKPALEPAK